MFVCYRTRRGCKDPPLVSADCVQHLPACAADAFKSSLCLQTQLSWHISRSYLMQHAQNPACGYTDHELCTRIPYYFIPRTDLKGFSSPNLPAV